ncbi:hypothetical protein [Teredinibacter turnerae]|uniref:hypothetical protein n=1 Tax=Teredinibacter turnerae TaxID=2426 RepID=UPI00037BA388|nr:hypothetical protein [Teredinibacter turnerae]
MESEEPSPLVLSTCPPSPTDDILRQKFDEEIAAQITRMDELGKLLITIELSVPGLYATALKLVQGMQAIVTGIEVAIAFFCWFVALLMTLWAVLPKKYNVDRNVIYIEHSTEADQALSIEAFFQSSAQYKYCRLLIACGFFFIGIIAATVSIF